MNWEMWNDLSMVYGVLITVHGVWCVVYGAQRTVYLMWLYGVWRVVM
jgi:hypothetical protein